MSSTLAKNNTGDSLKLVVEVNKTPEETYQAINNVRAWWTGCIVGDATKVGNIWIYCYPNIHFTKFKVAQLVPGKKVVWHVLDSYIDIDGDKEEWNNTDVVFDITKTRTGTEIVFTHIGLVPNFACYEGCKEGWSFYINESLPSYIRTGKGDPGSTIEIA